MKDMGAENDENEKDTVVENTRRPPPSEASSGQSSGSTQSEHGTQDALGKDDVFEQPELRDLTIPVHQEKEVRSPEEKTQESSSEDEVEELSLKARVSSIPLHYAKPVRQEIPEDPICTRTRARHSLANYTLEELETFLQESDDDDDLHNVDDEEEYRKFLAAVLLEGTKIGDNSQEYENFDEDEDEDADFVVEIEEALESDIDEDITNSILQCDDHRKFVRRPETRQKKRMKESAKRTKQPVELAKVPLLPKLPQIAPFPINAELNSFPNGTLGCLPSSSSSNVSFGFQNNQLSQLYCLIHEHAQLLIQVFSVCILDPFQQQVALKVQAMIKEMVVRHEEALASRKVPYDASFFQPPNLSVSVQVDLHQLSKQYQWKPLTDPPILSILDVAPLRLAKNYLNDVSEIVSQYRQRCLTNPVDKSHLKKEPLFRSPMLSSHTEADEEAVPGLNAVPPKATMSGLPGVMQPKKSLAATLMENSKKQSVALVPADIAKAAQRFFPLFNAALYPHKPPVPAVANRVLFTDAEDGLLAMGLMAYNNNWEAIQRHYLPCKSKHQIFVRQKNRCSSKAPENPIKAVRHLKASPLTEDEKALISKGLKKFQHDWLSVWKFFVPHRDPSLLPRQWRIAMGTQKSYKKHGAVREKRRVYEANRRRLKTSKTNAESSGQEVDNGGDNSGNEMDTEQEAYVHEAFLADSEAVLSNQLSHDIPSACRHGRQSIHVMDRNSMWSIRESAVRNNSTNSLPNATHSSSYCLSSKYASQIKKSSQLTSTNKGSKVVKLAPELPPINLPSTVRIISQSGLKLQHGGSRNSYASSLPRDVRAGSSIFSGDLPDSSQHDVGACKTRFVGEQRTNDTELQIHPLLFQVPEDHTLSNSEKNDSTANNSDFLRGSQLQSGFRVFRSQHVTAEDSNRDAQSTEGSSDICTIDFHPLLQRSCNASADPAIASSRSPSHPEVLAVDGNFDNSSEPSCGLREIQHNNGQNIYNGMHSCIQEEESTLDLDISLSSMGNEKEIGEKHTTNHGLTDRNNSASEQNMLDRTSLVSCTPFQLWKDKLSEVPGNSVDHPRVPCDEAANSLSVLQLGSICPLQSEKQSCGDSLPGIVMEQEELSDSVEESEELEFEHEEIDDSEGDDLDAAVSESRAKEFPPFTLAEGNFQVHCAIDQLNKQKTREESSKEADNASSILRASQTSGNSELPQRMPRNQNTKGGVNTSKASQNAPNSNPNKTKRARERKSNLKLKSSESQKVNVHTDCKTVVASRKTRRRTICK